jgi:hypothetical protein
LNKTPDRNSGSGAIHSVDAREGVAGFSRSDFFDRMINLLNFIHPQIDRTEAVNSSVTRTPVWLLAGAARALPFII